MICFSIPLITAANNEIARRHADVIRRAIDRAYGSQKAACIDMDVRPSHWSEALSGERGLPKGFLSLSPAFFAWYGVYLAQEFGIPEEFKTGARVVLGLIAQKRLARMPWPRVERRRSA